MIEKQIILFQVKYFKKGNCFTLSKASQQTTIITGNYFLEDKEIGLYTAQFSYFVVEDRYEVKISEKLSRINP